MKSPIHIAVTGAAGQISYSLLFRLAAGALFGPNQPIVCIYLKLLLHYLFWKVLSWS